MQFLILGWVVLDITSDSSAKLGLMIFLYGVPNLAFVLFGGILADRLDKRGLVVVTQVCVTIIILVLATLKTADVVEMWHLYTAALFLGVLQALNQPARVAIISELVPREDIMNAIALNQVVVNAGRILGPALAGWIIELSGTGPALYFNAGIYFLGTVSMFFMRSGSQRKTTDGKPVLRDLITGLNYFRATPVVFTIIGIGFGMGFFAMPYVQVMPAFAKEVLGAGAASTGLLLMAAGIGSLLGSLFLASLGNFQHKNWLLIGAALTFPSALLLFALSHWYWISWSILLVVGFGVSGYTALGNGVLQTTVPRDVLGRVTSIWSAGAALIQIGALPMGIIADRANWPTAIGGGASMLLVVVLVMAVWRPFLRQLKV